VKNGPLRAGIETSLTLIMALVQNSGISDLKSHLIAWFKLHFKADNDGICNSTLYSSPSGSLSHIVYHS